MNDEFLIEMKNFNEIDLRIRQEIDFKFEKLRRNKNEDLDDDKINKLLTEMSQCVEKLDKININNINKKLSSINKVSLRHNIIEEIKSNNKKLRNFLETIFKYKIDSTQRSRTQSEDSVKLNVNANKTSPRQSKFNNIESQVKSIFV
jgi:hypothetical protein